VAIGTSSGATSSSMWIFMVADGRPCTSDGRTCSQPNGDPGAEWGCSERRPIHPAAHAAAGGGGALAPPACCNLSQVQKTAGTPNKDTQADLQCEVWY
jgi:hypothetical protein